MSLKLEEVPFEFEGKTYMLRCNMAVLEEIQDRKRVLAGNQVRLK